MLLETCTLLKPGLLNKNSRKNVKAINQNLDFVVKGKLPTNELIKIQFDSIRILIDYCEKLALEGESAIQTID